MKEPVDIATLRRVLGPMRWIDRYFRASVDGLDHLPKGAALLVGNHSGGTVTPDSFVFLRAYYEHVRCAEPLVLLGHSVVVNSPGLGTLLRRFGAVAASPGNAASSLASGHKVMVYPGGDWEAMRPSRDRDRIDFGDRKGFVKTALRAGVPIVPVVAAGGHDGWYVITRGARLARALGLHAFRIKAFPIALAWPLGLVVGPVNFHIPRRATIRVEVLPPIRLEGSPDDPAAIDLGYKRVTAAMQSALSRLAQSLPSRQRRSPA